jgi:hypothetical protein
LWCAALQRAQRSADGDERLGAQQILGDRVQERDVAAAVHEHDPVHDVADDGHHSGQVEVVGLLGLLEALRLLGAALLQRLVSAPQGLGVLPIEPVCGGDRRRATRVVVDGRRRFVGREHAVAAGAQRQFEGFGNARIGGEQGVDAVSARAAGEGPELGRRQRVGEHAHRRLAGRELLQAARDRAGDLGPAAARERDRAALGVRRFGIDHQDGCFRGAHRRAARRVAGAHRRRLSARS